MATHRRIAGSLYPCIDTVTVRYIDVATCRCGGVSIRRCGAGSHYGGDVTKIVSVHSRKGGVGKTTIAYELAWLLGGVLVDLEWDDGGATRAWGYNHEDRVSAPMVEALERGRTPRPIVGHRKPAL